MRLLTLPGATEAEKDRDLAVRVGLARGLDHLPSDRGPAPTFDTRQQLTALFDLS